MDKSAWRRSRRSRGVACRTDARGIGRHRGSPRGV